MIFGKTFEESKKDIESKYSDFPFKKKFAFIPVSLSDGRYIWLECYYICVYKNRVGRWVENEFGMYTVKYIEDNFRDKV